MKNNQNQANICSEISNNNHTNENFNDADINIENTSTSTSSSLNSNEEGNQTRVQGFELLNLSDSNDDDNNLAEREYIPGCFEGPEKTLEVYFVPNLNCPRGCRALTRQQLEAVCKKAKCSIISSIHNDFFDSYLLSESSMFIYPYKVILKTCGTTTLLKCLPTLLNSASLLGLSVEWVGYSRKNFLFPNDQLFPHSRFEDELKFIQSHSHLCSLLNGSGYVLGPLTGDHWFVYIADKCLRSASFYNEVTINIMMFDMDAKVYPHFFHCNSNTPAEVRSKLGIDSLIEGSIVDDFVFEPCGYSMNAMNGESYYTIHVTPEPECSYASFETNKLSKSYNDMIRNVINTFRPTRFLVTIMGDEHSVPSTEDSPYSMKEVTIPEYGTYEISYHSSTKVGCDDYFLLGTWNLKVDQDFSNVTA